MKTSTLVAAALAGAFLAAPAFAQDTQTSSPKTPTTAGQARGQGTAVTGSSELGKTVPSPSDASIPDPKNVNPETTNAARYGQEAGQGTAVTGSSEVGKQAIPASRPYNEDPNNVIGKGPVVQDGNTVSVIPRGPTPGEVQGLQRGQGTTATGASELNASGKTTTAPGQ